MTQRATIGILHLQTQKRTRQNHVRFLRRICKSAKLRLLRSQVVVGFAGKDLLCHVAFQSRVQVSKRRLSGVEQTQIPIFSLHADRRGQLWLTARLQRGCRAVQETTACRGRRGRASQSLKAALRLVENGHCGRRARFPAPDPINCRLRGRARELQAQRDLAGKSASFSSWPSARSRI